MSGTIMDRRGRTRLHLHRYPLARSAGADPGGAVVPSSPEAPSTDESPEGMSWRQVFRNGGLLLGLLVVGWVIVEGVPMVWNRATLLRTQRQCLDYPGPEGLPVGRAPECWVNFCAAAGVQDASEDHVLFMHGLRSKGGTERLVVVKEGPPRWSNEGFYPPRPTWVSVTPVGWRGRPVGTIGQRHQAFARNDTLPKVRPPFDGDGILHRPDDCYFAGSVDPDDPSHFRIRYRVEGWEIRYSGRYRWFGGVGLIEGWLQDDGSVRMQFNQTDPIPPPQDLPPGASEPPVEETVVAPPARPTRPPPAAPRMRE
jgi:hypothetical protein